MVISAPWALAIARQEGDFWHYFFWVEHIQRFADADAQHKAPFWYYLPVVLAGSLPWLALLPGALAAAWRQRGKHADAAYLLSWVLLPLLFFSIAKGKLPTYILPCFAPLALLMARYAHSGGARLGRVFRINGGINLLLGLIATAAVVLFLAPWGVARHPLYARDETLRAAAAAAAFAGWGIAGWLSLRPGDHRWQLAALCPLALALLVGYAIPQKVRDSKQPLSFVSALRERLAGSRYLLADNPGVASAIAWTLRRSDITLYDAKGEVQYGLSYPDARARYVDGAAFAGWLQAHRRHGRVAVIVMLNSGEKAPDATMPTPDERYRQGRLLYYGYDEKP